MANPAKQLIEAGFVLEVIDGGGLGVTPRAKLTDEWSRFIRANKPQILASLIEAANDGDLIEAPAPPAPDPDRATWPHGPAMNRAEIDRMAARLRTFEAQGMPLGEAEAEADRLMHLERARSSPAPLSAVPPPATPPAPPKRHPYPTSELDRLYMRHHFACRVCQAVGRGIGTRCAVGLTYHLTASSRMPMS